MMEVEEQDYNNMEAEATNLELSNAATTIDASNRPSRISQSVSLQMQEGHEEEGTDQPHFPKLNALQSAGGKTEYRRVRCPPHRYTPLRDHWEQILTPLVEYLKLQVRTCEAYTN
jgi:RNA-binding protein PNO1